MNIPTIIILVLIAALFGLAVWRTVKKKGGCDCGSADASGGCAGCHGCAGHTAQPPQN